MQKSKKSPFKDLKNFSDEFKDEMFKKDEVVSIGYDFILQKPNIWLEKGTDISNFIKNCEYDLNGIDITSPNIQIHQDDI